jgi:hypothetical protein
MNNEEKLKTLSPVKGFSMQDYGWHPSGYYGKPSLPLLKAQPKDSS